MSDSLVVTSKVKKYVRESAGMSTSATAIDALTEIVKRECNAAIERAQGDKRKTVKDRDFIAPAE
jgi:histone H3/H4